MNDLGNRSTPQLLADHAAIMEELRRRGVLRSANNPTGDLAEWLFCKAFGWKQEASSAKAFDALDARNTRFQIKGRRQHRRNKSTQMSAIRDLDGFDVLAAVLFDEYYRVVRAAHIPVEIVRKRSTYVAHTNSHKFILRDDVWNIPGVVDATDSLRVVEANQ